MFRKLVSLLLSLLLLTAPALAESVAVSDMYGREITLEHPAERVVALMAADCEILCALGCEDALVAVGDYCDYPPTLAEKPALSSGAETNIEQIIALQPDVVILSSMAHSKALVESLENAGIAVAVSNANSIDETYAAIRMIGGLMGRETEAEALVADMSAAFAGLAENPALAGKTVYFEVSPLEWGLWTAGQHTFMDELASLCGLTNAFADVDGWGAVSEEQVLARDPDFIVTIAMYFGEGPTPVEEIMGRPAWQSLKAVRNAAVFNADSDEISRPGPRLADAALALYAFASQFAD